MPRVRRKKQKQDQDAQQQNKPPAKRNAKKKGQEKVGGGKQEPKAQQKGKAQKGNTRGGQLDNARAKQRLELIIRSKFQNPEKDSPSELESTICEHLVDLEASNKDLKPALRDLGINSARTIKISPNKNCIIVFVPFAQYKRWQKIQSRISAELEKKLSGQEVLFIAQRKVVKLNQIKNNYPRDRNTTITAVHNALLQDIVFPTKIVGKRTRFRVGGKRLIKVYLDPKATNIESKLSTYEVVYNRLTRKTVKFLFPRYVI